MPESNDEQNRLDGQATSKKNNSPQFQQRLENSLSKLFEMGRGTTDFNYERLTYDTDDENGIFSPRLDAEIYRYSDKYVTDDGSLNPDTFYAGKSTLKPDELLSSLASKMSISPEIPSSSKSEKMHSTAYQNEQRIMDSLSSTNKIDPEEIYAKIFENEEGFLNQSTQFRKVLSPLENNRQEILNDATAWRRGEDYRKRQQEAMAKMEAEMAAIERMLLSKEDALKLANQPSASQRTTGGKSAENRASQIAETVLCSKCECLLPPKDIFLARKMGIEVSQMKCRGCYADDMAFKNASPFLMGKIDRQGNIISAPINLDPRYDRSKQSFERNPSLLNRDHVKTPKVKQTSKEVKAESPEEWRERFRKVSLRKTKMRGTTFPTRRRSEITPSSIQNVTIKSKESNNNSDINRNNLITNESQVSLQSNSEIRNHENDSLRIKELEEKVLVLETELERYKMELEYSLQLVRELEDQLGIDSLPF